MTAEPISLHDTPLTAVCWVIDVADDAVKVCQQRFPWGHPIRRSLDDALFALHDARRAAEVIP